MRPTELDVTHPQRHVRALRSECRDESVVRIVGVGANIGWRRVVMLWMVGQMEGGSWVTAHLENLLEIDPRQARAAARRDGGAEAHGHVNRLGR